VELEVRELLSNYQFPATIGREGDAPGALNGDAKRGIVDIDGEGGRVYSAAGASNRQAVHHADRGDISILGRGTVVTGRTERYLCKVGEEMEIVGFRTRGRRWCDGRRDVQEAAGRRSCFGDNVGPPPRGIEKKMMSSAGR